MLNQDQLRVAAVTLGLATAFPVYGAEPVTRMVQPVRVVAPKVQERMKQAEPVRPVVPVRAEVVREAVKRAEPPKTGGGEKPTVVEKPRVVTAATNDRAAVKRK